MMNDRSSRNMISVIGAAVGAAAAVWGLRKLVTRFEAETEKTIRALKRRSRVVETSAGPVEISVTGEGPPVLVVHGAAGGYDQGEVKSEEFSGIQYISISRPGYLRTPLATGETPAEQADAMAALLDALSIPKAAFIGTSTGGLIGMFFALRHPERCSALILVSSVNAPLSVNLSIYGTLSPLLASDFLPWVVLHPEPYLMIHPTLRSQMAAAPEKIDIVEQLLQAAYPTSLRLSGMLNDAYQIDHLKEIPLEAIRVPTLVIHGTSDDVVPYAQGVYSASKIPGAKFLPVYQGTHYSVLTHLELTRPAIMEFIKQHTAD